MRIRIFIPFLAVTLLLAACNKEDQPVQPQTPPANDTTGTNNNGGNNNGTNDTKYAGTNGLVLNGLGVTNKTIHADSVGVKHGGANGFTSTIIELYFKHDGKECRLDVKRYGARQIGSFNWGAPSFEGGGSTLMISDVDRTEYAEVSGSTIVTNIGQIGETIDGSFSGTLALRANPEVKIRVNGKFSGIRTY